MHKMHTKTTRLIVVGLAGFLALTVLSGCQNRLKQERDALMVQNEELQDELNQARAANDALQAETDRLRDKLAERPEPQPQPTAGANTPFAGIEGIESERGPGRVTVRVPGDVLFASGKSALRGSAKNTLREIAGVITSEYAGRTIRVEGYTDTDPIRKSDWQDNLELSLHRAAAVERYLQQQGVDGDRMYSAGFGESDQRSSKAKSRRVEIVVVLNN